MIFSVPFVTIYQAKNIENDDFVPTLIDGANSCHYVIIAIRQPVTHKRQNRRNREITVRRGSLAVFSIRGTVKFPLSNRT